MPAAVMENFDRGSPFSQSDSQSPQEWNTSDRREKNRDAARKSRKKQTEKADLLHEELQTLEQANAAYVKEIADLKKQLQIYKTALEQHEPHCTRLGSFGPPASVSGAPSTATPSTSDYISSPNLLADITFLPNTNSVSLTDLFDWTPWDSMNDNGFQL
ncbi:basic leucine zipper transcriptional factor ATF-like [Danio aesculapii]|uniref:basic leucine zipper transcriptional factor ATF-like n=1 Tax=Danio aesculapii TaxID=1142201 RepID=UPI0024BFCEC8|nr:basic leucine zipper transcriptional factor ATF-like [Danio aesculapii]